MLCHIGTHAEHCRGGTPVSGELLVSLFATETLATELVLLLTAFLLCALIGIERQVRQKPAGFRTHVLVGCGSATFTLVSGFGFSWVLGDDVLLDPSRIAAQIVSGIGFLGAGVIFTRRDIVVGLTTAATIWVTAAVGMACGAGMVGLAAALTMLHLFALVIIAPLLRRLPTVDRNRIVRVRYLDGHGILRSVLSAATLLGFETSILSTTRETRPESDHVIVNLRFRGRIPLRDLMQQIGEIRGVQEVALRSGVDDEANN